MHAPRLAAVLVGTFAAISLNTPAAMAGAPDNSVTGVTVTPTTTTTSECFYTVAVDLTHRGPVHVDALATDGTVNYGGGNTELRGSGSYTFVQTVALPKGVTATFFGDLYRHQGPNRFVLLDYRAEPLARTCS